MSSDRNEFRQFLFRGLMLEADALRFQSAGIQIGADTKQAEERLLSEALSPFNVSSRNNAIEMARLYSVLHCFENEVRALIRETLEEKEGPDWAEKLPKKTKEFAESRQKTAYKDTWLEGEKSDILGFVDFGQLSAVIIEKWTLFEDLIPSQHWLRQRMEELEKARNFIAHNRMLLPTEFNRIYLYIADWNRVVGL